MRVLALDTTDAIGSAALFDRDRIIMEQRGDPARPHAERLPGDLLALLAEADMPLDAVDLFAVARGPGSFTGLRIGIATIQGLAFVTGKPIVAVSALEALAHAASTSTGPASLVGVWINAHRRDVFSGLYQMTDAPLFTSVRLQELEPPAVGDPATTLERWTARHGPPRVIAGDGARLYADRIGRTSAVVDVPLLAGTIAMMAASTPEGDRVDAGGVQPLYVRRPDAEIARDERRARAEDATARP